MLISSMGVINITPDSFSDGSQFNSKDSFAKRFEELLHITNIIDIGAESSAPGNSSISEKDERERFEQVLIPLMKERQDPQITISVDTYKISVFKYVANLIHEHWPNCEIIFNDISGVIDSELLELFKSFPINFSYIYSHNLIQNRSDVSAHMKFSSRKNELEFIKEIVNYFLDGLKKLDGVKQKVLIDPCFGFSKTREQNHYLLKYFKTFLLQIPYDVSCVYGVSRKSFLRFPKDLDIKNEQNLKEVEQIHSILLFELIKIPFNREMIVRLHDPQVLINAMNAKKIFDI